MMSHRSRSLLFVAGEASGDLHASKVIAHLNELSSDVRIFGVGGDLMQSAGMELSHHSSDFAVVGFAEVIRHIPRLKRAMRELLDMVSKRQTRVAVLVDYPGFNLALARALKAAGVKVFYYIREFGEIDFKLGLAEGMDPSELEVAGDPALDGVEVMAPGDTHDLMAEASVLMVSSGTATLEAACFGTPMVIVYRTSPLSYRIGRLLVKIPQIGLVNIVAGERVVPELVQADLTPERLAAGVSDYLKDERLYVDTSRRLLGVRDLLGEPGAAEKVAESILAMMEEA
jgi:lipid A disaccharide synthetase